MNRSDALRFLIAAQEDPVLAAWASVVHSYGAAANCEVSPYEHLDAFHQLFDYGLISPDQLNRTDTPRVFFSGKRPMDHDVQRVLDNLRRPLCPSPLEYPMTKTKFPDSPFAAKGLVTTSGNGSITQSPRPALPTSRAPAPLNPFSQSREMPAGRSARELAPFATNGAPLARQAPGPSVEQMGGLDLRVFCCGVQLQMTVQDMQGEGGDAIAGGHVEVIDSILHGTCSKCNREHHHSVAEVIEHERFR